LATLINNFASLTATQTTLGSIENYSDKLEASVANASPALNSINNHSWEISRVSTATSITVKLNTGDGYVLYGSNFFTAPSVSSIAYNFTSGAAISMSGFINYSYTPIDQLSGTITLIQTQATDGTKVQLEGLGNIPLDEGFTANRVTIEKGGMKLVVQGNISFDANGDFSGTISAIQLTSGSNSLALSGLDANASVLNGTGSSLLDRLLSGDDLLQGNTANNLIWGLEGNDTLDGLNGNDTLQGGNGNDRLLGGAGNDSLLGDAGDDYLEGGLGNDTLVSGTGTDTLDGGAGDDIYMLSGTGTTVNESIAGSSGGNDTITLLNGFSGPISIIGTYIENINGSALASTASIQISGSSIANTLIGGAGNDAITGDAGNDTLTGNNGNDTLSGEADNDSLSGGGGDDSLSGGIGDDRLDGGIGADELSGGAGNDLYLVTLIKTDGVNASMEDILTESIDEGNDTVRLIGSQTFTTPALLDMTTTAFDNIENLDISGTGSSKLDIHANAADNVLTGNASANTITGNDGNDVIVAGAGNDSLEGNAGNDTLDGGTGADTMAGGAGDDTYYVDNTGDVIIDVEGSNTLYINLASGTYTLANELEFENIFLSGKANLSLKGNDADNNLSGNIGANKLEGMAGNDTLIGDAGNDTLDGGADDDWMEGGAGNDIYIVDSYSDNTYEEDDNSRTGGIDTVRIASDYNSNSHSLNINIENLDASLFAGGIALTGNELANIITGGNGDDVLDGGGMYSEQILADKLIGGKGDDTYIVDLASSGSGSKTVIRLKDTVVEAAGIDSGDDTINLRGYIMYDANDNEITKYTTLTLGTNLENLNAIDTVYTLLNLTGNATSNHITGNAADNTLLGLAGNDTLEGDYGNDVLNGGTGFDTLIGGEGDDTYYVNLAMISGAAALEDTITETEGENDTLNLTGTLKLTDATKLVLSLESEALEGIDNIDASATTTTLVDIIGNGSDNKLTGNAAANNLSGGDGDDTLHGNAGNDALVGGEGNDSLDGGLGNDTMKGGAGDDLYIVNAITDVVDEEGNADSNDTIQASINIDLSNPSYADIEHVILTGTSALNAKGSDSVGNILIGNSGANKLEGLAGDDHLEGGAGNDTLDGGAGDDFLVGGSGNDVYIIDSQSDYALELETGGIDTAKLSSEFTGARYELGEDLENIDASAFVNADALDLAGVDALELVGNELANRITGSVMNDILDGGQISEIAFDTLVGGDGNDIYNIDIIGKGRGSNAAIFLKDTVIETAGENSGTEDTIKLRNVITEDPEGTEITRYSTITIGTNIEYLDASETGNTLLNFVGNTANNLIIGNDTDNTLDGGTGADTLRGGNGDDKYYVDNAGDLIDESASDGTDQVFIKIAIANGSYSLTDNIENATLLNTVAFTLNGNEWDNYLIGNAAANTLIGDDGNDTLDGGGGIDMMNGGEGDDTYYIDRLTDVIIDSGGNDTVVVKLTSGTYTLTDDSDIENITLSGTAALHAQGNIETNIIRGNSAANKLEGFGGNDEIYAGAGNDTLDGGTGNDTMYGGMGNDIYIVDSIDDTVDEADYEYEDGKTGGIDTIRLQGYMGDSFTLNDFSFHVENLDASLLAGGLTLTGNDLANTITGTSGSDILDGGDFFESPADKLVGGKGNDTYTVDLIVSGRGSKAIIKIQDTITELSGVDSGTDTVILRGSIHGDIDGNPLSKASTITLAANLENLDAQFTGTTMLNLTGNTANNSVTGNATANTILGLAGDDILNGKDGNDSLDGGIGNDLLQGEDDDDILIGNTGNDTLTGGTGDDIFVFNSTLNQLTNVDTITDFGDGEDVLRLSKSIFKKLASGVSTDNIANDTTAADANDYLIYDASTGNLYYDADGSGIGNATLFAVLENKPASLSAEDFQII
jgi:Ca2+-binding RTX toxin-like protein